MNIKKLFPLIVPKSYVGSGWKLPHQILPNPEFVLTWVEFNTPSAMTYLTEDVFRDLEPTFTNWQQQSFQNLRNEDDYFHTHVKHRDSDRKIIFLSFLNSDGIGSSRILLNVELAKGFPNGYYVALPDRSCGLAISKEIDKKELDDVRISVNNMYKKGTVPMSGEIFDPTEFSLPSEWTLPIDRELSEQIIANIPNPF